MKTLIAGAGFVGAEMFKLFPQSIVYDPYKTYREVSWAKSYFVTKPETCDMCIVCVSTPIFRANPDSLQNDGSCDVSAVQDTVAKIKASTYLIKSTVNPGFTKKLQLEHPDRRFVFSPEYVASSSPYPAPLADIKARTFHILGGEESAVKNVRRFLETVYPPTCEFMETDSTTAELIKLFENTAIANKVTLCNEFYDICRKWGVDYDTVRKGVFGLDPRFTEWWTYIRENNRGWGGHCLPKDISNLITSSMELGYDPKFLKSIVESNERHQQKTGGQNG